MQHKPKDSLRQAASDKSSEANISAARRDDPPVSTPSAAEKTNYSVCSKYLNREDGCPQCWPSLHSGQAVDRQQEWTVTNITGDHWDLRHKDMTLVWSARGVDAKPMMQAIAKCHNAALTTEQARNAALVASLAVIAHSPNVSENIREIALAHTKDKHAGAFLIKQLRELRQELAAERQRREQDKSEYDAHRSGLQEACDVLRAELKAEKECREQAEESLRLNALGQIESGKDS